MTLSCHWWLIPLGTYHCTEHDSLLSESTPLLRGKVQCLDAATAFSKKHSLFMAIIAFI